MSRRYVIIKQEERMINKKILAKKLAKSTLLTQKEADQVVDRLFDIIINELKRGEDISIVGFGKFYLYEHAPRPVRNPKTQEEMILKSYKSMRFKTSNVIKKLLKDQSYNEDSE
jgi:DNA-binding protein HU-beta